MQERQQKPGIELAMNILLLVGSGVILNYMLKAIVKVILGLIMFMGDKLL